MGIPVTIVSGFLGAGKTTLINQALASTHIPKEEILIVENEFGEAGIDHELLLHTDEQILQLNNGCMCCSLREDLVTVLFGVEELADKLGQPISQLIIETTGIADPQPILQTLLTTPHLRDRYYIDSILTVVDSQNFTHCLAEPILHKQLAVSDRIFLSLKDENEPSILLERLKQLNPLADQRVFSAAAPIEGMDFFQLNKFHEPLQLADKDDHTASLNHPDDHSQQHEGHHHSHDHENEHGFQTLAFSTDQPLNEKLLTRWLDWLLMVNQEQLYRLKGIVTLQDRDLAIAVQGVNQQVNFQLTTIPAGSTKIVLIGKELDAQQIEETFYKICKISA